MAQPSHEGACTSADKEGIHVSVSSQETSPPTYSSYLMAKHRKTDANQSIIRESSTPQIAQNHYDLTQTTSQTLAAWHFP